MDFNNLGSSGTTSLTSSTTNDEIVFIQFDLNLPTKNNLKYTAKFAGRQSFNDLFHKSLSFQFLSKQDDKSNYITITTLNGFIDGNKLEIESILNQRQVNSDLVVKYGNDIKRLYFGLAAADTSTFGKVSNNRTSKT